MVLVLVLICDMELVWVCMHITGTYCSTLAHVWFDLVVEGVYDGFLGGVVQLLLGLFAGRCGLDLVLLLCFAGATGTSAIAGLLAAAAAASFFDFLVLT